MPTKFKCSALFVGDPIPAALALKRWPHRRYSTPAKKGSKNGTVDSKRKEDMPFITECKAHYSKAEVDGHPYKLNDYVTTNAEEAGKEYTGRILELFETTDKARWLEIQWMFRAEDTVLGQEEAKQHDEKRLFYSDETDAIPLECITSKIKVLQEQPQLHLPGKRKPCSEFYFDMGYAYEYSTFYTIKTADKAPAADDRNSGSAVINPSSLHRLNRSKRQPSPVDSASVDSTQTVTNRRITRTCKSKLFKVSNQPQHESSSSDSCVIDDVSKLQQSKMADNSILNGSFNKELSVLDMYCGCGGMSTGLHMGASLSNVKIETRWAVDINENSCATFKLNHANAEVRNEAAEDFLSLIKAWQKLCQKYTSDHLPTSSAKSKAEVNNKNFEKTDTHLPKQKRRRTCHTNNEDNSHKLRNNEYEVEEIIGVRWLDPIKHRKSGLEFKVHWKGYPEDEDSWEALESLEGCQELLKNFVVTGRARKILPLPGEVDIICGGPPCQGISGLNRFRNTEAPLQDPKNQQIVVFMDVVQFLKPRFVFLENVVDILQFSGGLLARYALSRLVQMHFQAKIGLLVAGSFGLPQFRMRFFLLGASPSETLPAFPLPTHYVPLKGCKPSEWERNIVAYPENCTPQLNEAILLKDAISDLPTVTNAEKREQLRHTKQPSTEFQKFMRLPKENGKQKATDFVEDHRPLVLNRDDFERIQKIPKKKGANFRDLPGLRKLADGTVQMDAKNVVKLSSGKQLVPNYALNYMQGKSSKPFGRIWWDEILSTLHTTPSPHHQKMIHPTQDRVLTIRECARLQGFPDYYKFCGPIKERYRQLGNAVAVPVAKALGYTLGLAVRGEGAKEDIRLPRDFSLRQRRRKQEQEREPKQKPKQKQKLKPKVRREHSANMASTNWFKRTLRPRHKVLVPVASSKI